MKNIQFETRNNFLIKYEKENTQKKEKETFAKLLRYTQTK